ncbi:MAG: OmpH family outer membrane protein [Aureispira sp.]
MRLFIVASLLICMSSFALAQTQKVAYVASENIIPAMAEYKKAQSELQAYTKQLEKILQQKKAAIEKDYAAVMDSVQKGIMTKIQQERAQVRLETGQQKLQQEAMNADQKVAKKEGQLIEPLYKKFNDALEAVARDEGYTYIIDKKFLLYSVGGIDATAQVKEKLGM